LAHLQVFPHRRRVTDGAVESLREHQGNTEGVLRPRSQEPPRLRRTRGR
jgi:hypothetical protein